MRAAGLYPSVRLHDLRHTAATIWLALGESIYFLQQQPRPQGHPNHHRPLAVEGDTGVARLEVVYDDPPSARYRDLWILTLATDGRCTAFEEWPFFPDQPRVATAAHGA